MRLMRVDPDAASKAMTEEELRTIVDVSHEDGVIESDEKEMIYNVVDLGDAKAKDVMVQRVDIVAVDTEATYEEVLEVIIKNLVNNKDAVEIKEVENEKSIVFEVKVADEDFGKVIGKQGKIAQSIRTVMKAVAGKKDKKVNVEFIG